MLIIIEKDNILHHRLFFKINYSEDNAVCVTKKVVFCPVTVNAFYGQRFLSDRCRASRLKTKKVLTNQHSADEKGTWEVNNQNMTLKIIVTTHLSNNKGLCTKLTDKVGQFLVFQASTISFFTIATSTHPCPKKDVSSLIQP